MKKIIIPFLASLVLATSVYADDSIKLLKGTEEIVSDVSAYKDGETVMIPLRAVFESIGMNVSWEPERKTIIMVEPNTSEFIAMQIGSEKVFLGETTVDINPAAKISENRTFVPVEFIIDNFSDNFEWNAASNTLTVK